MRWGFNIPRARPLYEEFAVANTETQAANPEGNFRGVSVIPINPGRARARSLRSSPPVFERKSWKKSFALRTWSERLSKSLQRTK